MILAFIMCLVATGLAIKGYIDFGATHEINVYVWVSLALSIIATIIACIKHKEINL